MAAPCLYGFPPYVSTGANSLVDMRIENYSLFLSDQTVNQPSWVQLYAPAENTDTVILGGEHNDGTNGVPIFPGAAFLLPQGLDLRKSKLFFLGAADLVYIVIGGVQ